MLLLGFALNYLAMTGLCLAMSRHHKLLLNGAPSQGRQRLLRGLAALGLLGGLLLCWRALGGEIGAVVWLCQLMLAGLLLVSLLAWRERLVFAAAVALPAAGGLALLV
ncbi:DUF3325 domain-containing protein [Aquipseudomonas ullengensis]|uniref:DUF3325 domain-containing protein n=1 Tax=Aquipseudomonas ullengensis TaxID=2759166 RepID=UPI001F3FCC0A